MSQELLQRVDSFLWQPRPNYMPPQLKSVVVLEHCGGVRQPQAMLAADAAVSGVLDRRRASTPRHGDGGSGLLLPPLRRPVEASIDGAGGRVSASAGAGARAHALVATAFLSSANAVDVRSADALLQRGGAASQALMPVGATVGAEGLVVVPSRDGSDVGASAAASGNVDPQLVFSHSRALKVRLEQGGGQWGARSPAAGQACAACGMGTEQRLATMASALAVCGVCLGGGGYTCVTLLCVMCHACHDPHHARHQVTTAWQAPGSWLYSGAYTRTTKPVCAATRVARAKRACSWQRPSQGGRMASNII